MLTQTFKRDRAEKISAAQAEQRLGAIFREGIEPEALERLTVDGRRAVVQVMEDLADQFPEVADRIRAVIHHTGRDSRGTLAAHIPPQRLPTRSLRNGEFYFKHAFNDKRKMPELEAASSQPRTGYYAFGSGPNQTYRDVRVPHFSAGSADDVLGHTVAHEFGHAVHGLAEDILHLTRNGELEFGGNRQSRRLLGSKINEALDEANLPRAEGDIAENISHYAITNKAETFAEAFAEVYNLGTEARPHSRAIVNGILKVIDDFDGQLP
tara:strand:- start:524 stop:1324 length:801 start_codon:yes stop_codon:yes gene_type:complete